MNENLMVFLKQGPLLREFKNSADEDNCDDGHYDDSGISR